MPETETFRIPRHRSHIPAARQRVRRTLVGWGVTGELADAVTLSANELATNAVTHCRVPCARIRITLTLDGPELVLEVSDPDRDGLPRPRDSAPDEESGRGLALVEASADSWGYRQGPYTKSVWARFTLVEKPAGARVPVPS
ncbi:ATP-binding protein [Streptomyces sp. BH-SS-21]|uniref:ATP-binding protein n=1 Tax=Streptomyces liliiviolaceus TaxID=2823109 RepID=A0A940XT15_9ACTN|nr:ATP-binding protein [Streptomyces liliiviolaceus]MBQ0847372.1 ATP-binding protein [Streptomyces liliiviolaceus]